MRIVIDTARCTGHGRCYGLAPDLVVDDERGYGQVIGDGRLGDEALRAQAERAVLACPERAVSIEEG
jgi:ferredoxin